MRPRNIIQDREKLYDECMHLRHLTNTLKEENLKFSTKIMTLEKENKKLNKNLLFSISSETPKPRTVDQKSPFLFELKHKIKQLEAAVSEKNQELIRTKQSVKYTKIQELEAENKNFLDENFRLKSLLASSHSEPIPSKASKDILKNDEFMFQHRLITKLREVCQKQQGFLERKDEEIVRLEVDREMLEKKTSRYLEEIKSLRKTVEKMREEAKKVRSENVELSVQISKLLVAVEKAESKSEKEKIEYENGPEFTLTDREDLKTIEKSFKNLMAQKDQVIQYQEKNIMDLRSKMDEKTKEFLIDKQSLEKELRIMKDLYEELNEKYKTLLNLRNLEEKKRIENQNKDLKSSPSRGFTRPASRTLIPSSFKKKEEISREMIFKKKVKRVTAEEVQILGYEIRLRMQLKRIPRGDIDELIISDDIVNDGKVSLRAMKDVIEDEPFCVGEKDSLLLARFLIEDNNFEYVEIDLESSNDVAVVKSIFKTLIGQYSLIDEMEERKLKARTQKFINKYGSSLKLFFKEYPKGSTGLNLTLKQFKDVFKITEIDVQDDVLAYMIKSLFAVSDDLNSLDKYKLFELFPIGTNLEDNEFYCNDSFFKEEI